MLDPRSEVVYKLCLLIGPGEPPDTGTTRDALSLTLFEVRLLLLFKHSDHGLFYILIGK